MKGSKKSRALRGAPIPAVKIATFRNLPKEDKESARQSYTQLWLGGLCPGPLDHGNIGISILPEGKEIPINSG
jgi:hypothetical protein